MKALDFVQFGGACNAGIARDRFVSAISSPFKMPRLNAHSHTPFRHDHTGRQPESWGVSVMRHISASSATPVPAGQQRACCTINSMKEVFAEL